MFTSGEHLFKHAMTFFFKLNNIVRYNEWGTVEILEKNN